MISDLMMKNVQTQYTTQVHKNKAWLPTFLTLPGSAPSAQTTNVVWERQYPG